MDCPFCRGSMVAGQVDTRRSGVGLLADLVTGDIGTSPHHLYFHPDGAGDDAWVDHARPAYRCRDCEAVVIAGTKAKPAGRKKSKPEARPEPEGAPSEAGPSNCPACGAAVGSGQARCPGCDIALR